MDVLKIDIPLPIVILILPVSTLRIEPPVLFPVFAVIAVVIPVQTTIAPFVEAIFESRSIL